MHPKVCMRVLATLAAHSGMYIQPVSIHLRICLDLRFEFPTFKWSKQSINDA